MSTDTEVHRLGPPPIKRWQAVGASLVIAIGLTAIVTGFLRATSGTDSSTLPPGIERVDPVQSAVRVPSQTKIFVDLAAGYTGELTIDGVRPPVVNLMGEVAVAPAGTTAGTLPAVAPGAQQVGGVIFEAGNATLTFTPTAGALIESFAEGRHTVTVTYWKLTSGRGAARSFTWTFDAF